MAAILVVLVYLTVAVVVARFSQWDDPFIAGLIGLMWLPMLPLALFAAAVFAIGFLSRFGKKRSTSGIER